jgi:hypothetical protein
MLFVHHSFVYFITLTKLIYSKRVATIYVLFAIFYCPIIHPSTLSPSLVRTKRRGLLCDSGSSWVQQWALEWLCRGFASFYSVSAGQLKSIFVKQATTCYFSVLSNFRSCHSTPHKATYHIKCCNFHRTFKFPHSLQPNFNCGPYRRTYMILWNFNLE